MAYSKYYPGGWQNDQAGGTPIIAAALNNMETGITNALDRTDMTAKGDLLVATASGTYSRLAVGSNDTVPVAASGQSTGIIWQQIGNAQIAAGAAIAYSKLNLTGAIVNGDLAGSIAVTKLVPGSNGQVLTTTGGVAAWGATISVYDRATTTVDIANTVTETSFYTKSILANDLSTNKMLRLTAVGDYLHNNVAADTFTFRVKFGGTTFYANASPFGTQIGANRHPWLLNLTLANLGATNSQFINGLLGPMARGNEGNPTTGIGTWGANSSGADPGMPYFGITTLGTIDTTANQTLDVTGQWSAASANNSWRMRYAVLELV